MKTDANGWYDVEPRSRWKCPNCGETSPVEDWRECEVYCEDCGSHDGRLCPACGDAFDHVWGSAKIEDASASMDPSEQPRQLP